MPDCAGKAGHSRRRTSSRLNPYAESRICKPKQNVRYRSIKNSVTRKSRCFSAIRAGGGSLSEIRCVHPECPDIKVRPDPFDEFDESENNRWSRLLSVFLCHFFRMCVKQFQRPCLNAGERRWICPCKFAFDSSRRGRMTVICFAFVCLR